MSLPRRAGRPGRLHWFGGTTSLRYSVASLDCGSASRRRLIFGRTLFAVAPRAGAEVELGLASMSRPSFQKVSDSMTEVAKDQPNAICLQRNPKVVANVNHILRPLLPTASTDVGYMQNAVVIKGQAQPLRGV